MCSFCEIVRGGRDAEIVLADDTCIAFLDHRPLFLGHVLLIPRQHHETLPDLPAELISPLFSNVQKLARAVPEAMQAEGTLVAMNNKISQSVPHLHVHVVPRRHKDGLRGFLWPRRRYRSEEERRQVAQAIRTTLQEMPRR